MTNTDIDFDKDGTPKMVPPPKDSDESIARRNKERAAQREAEIKKSAAEYEANPRRVDEATKKLQELIRRGGSGGGGRGGGGGINPRNPLDKMRLMAKGGITASKRADGIAQRGKTRGQMR